MKRLVIIYLVGFTNFSSLVSDFLLTKKLTNQLSQCSTNLGQMTLDSLRQGDCIQLLHEEAQFQVIGIDSKHKKCWVRQWPILPSGSPVFEVSIQQIAPA